MSAWRHRIMLIGYICLIAVQMGWPDRNAAGIAFALAPLALGLFLLSRAEAKYRFMAALMSLIYFVHGITEWMVADGSPVASIAELVSCSAILLPLLWPRRRGDRPDSA